MCLLKEPGNRVSKRASRPAAKMWGGTSSPGHYLLSLLHQHLHQLHLTCHDPPTQPNQKSSCHFHFQLQGNPRDEPDNPLALFVLKYSMQFAVKVLQFRQASLSIMSTRSWDSGNIHLQTSVLPHLCSKIKRSPISWHPSYYTALWIPGPLKCLFWSCGDRR